MRLLDDGAVLMRRPGAPSVRARDRLMATAASAPIA